MRQFFELKLFQIGKKMLMRKLYNGFHVGKNGIHISNFQKIVFLQIYD